MFGSRLTRLAQQSAAQTLGLRAGVVGVNFAVMMGLAGLLRFETFGQLAVLWGVALVGGTVVSLGGPLILLRMLTDGQGMRASDISKVALFYPVLVSICAYTILASIWPALPWATILGAGALANALGCLASVMRALGSVQVSMALRDAGPPVALGVAGVLGYGADATTIMAGATLVMLVMALAGAFWVCWRAEIQTILSPVRRPCWSGSLWASSVLGMLIAQIDLIVGGAVIPAEQLGVYAILRRIANLVALPVTVATWVSAAPVSAAYGAGNPSALIRASAQASRIAILPGLVLLTCGVLAIPLLPYLLPDPSGDGLGLIFTILLMGAFGQVFFAASFGVATLCNLSGLAMAARFLMIGLYVLWFQWWGTALAPLTNALGYVGAITLGGAALWWAVKRQLGVDTSAAVLLRAKGGQWKTS